MYGTYVRTDPVHVHVCPLSSVKRHTITTAYCIHPIPCLLYTYCTCTCQLYVHDCFLRNLYGTFTHTFITLRVSSRTCLSQVFVLGVRRRPARSSTFGGKTPTAPHSAVTWLARMRRTWAVTSVREAFGAVFSRVTRGRTDPSRCLGKAGWRTAKFGLQKRRRAAQCDQCRFELTYRERLLISKLMKSHSVFTLARWVAYGWERRVGEGVRVCGVGEASKQSKREGVGLKGQ